MTKDKQKNEFARWTVWILAALMFGGFLGSPVPGIWADHLSKMFSSAAENASEMNNIHNSRAEMTSAVVTDNINDSYNKDVPTGQALAEHSNDYSAANGADSKITTDTAIGDNGGENKVSETTAQAVQTSAAAPSVEAQPDYISINVDRGGIANRKEKDVLIHLINAEAYGLSYKAKVAVGQVVMNRWKGPYYGDDLLAIMTAPHQFTPIYDGSAYKKQIEPDSIQAANVVLSGAGVKDLTEDTYYFVNPDFTEDKTIETKMQFVCEIEGIYFYKPPAK